MWAACDTFAQCLDFIGPGIWFILLGVILYLVHRTFQVPHA